MQGIDHNNGNQWNYSRTSYVANEKRNEWIRNIPTWLLTLLPITMLKQETVQTFGANHTLIAIDDIPEWLQEQLSEAKENRGEMDALSLLDRIAYEKTTIPPVYQTSYQVNGQEIASTDENFRYNTQEGYTGHEDSLLNTQGFRDRFGRGIMLVEEEPFNHNGIGPGSNTISFKSSDPNNPYNASLLDGDLKNLPEQVTSQQIATRSRVGVVLDQDRAYKTAAVVGVIAVGVLMAYYGI